MTTASNVALYDQITSFRLLLRRYIYSDENFQQILHQSLSVLPIYQYEFDPFNISLKIILNKNGFAEIPEYEHNKSFYMEYVKTALLLSLSLYNSRLLETQTKDGLFEYRHGLINNVMNMCQGNPENGYKIFEVTAILNNVIFVYL